MSVEQLIIMKNLTHMYIYIYAQKKFLILLIRAVIEILLD